MVSGRARALALVLLAVGGFGCRGAASPGRDPRNLFPNPGFEEGDAPWFSLTTEPWGPAFVVSAAAAHSGTHSAFLRLRSDEPGPAGARIVGVVQDLSPRALPEAVGGYYRVEHWRQGSPKQYLQLVVIADGARNLPPDAAPATNHQIRYLLGGIAAAPLRVDNARYVVVAAAPPVERRWVHVVRDLRRDFVEQWGAIPEGFTRLRVLFEVRWDDRQPTDGPTGADVYFDDLYLGPAAGAG